MEIHEASTLDVCERDEHEPLNAATLRAAWTRTLLAWLAAEDAPEVYGEFRIDEVRRCVVGEYGFDDRIES